MVRAVVAERELERRQAGRQGKQLVSEADAEHRDAAEQLRDDRHLAGERFGSPGPFESSTPSNPASVSASTSCGNTVTDAPAPASRRMIERFAP